MRRLLDDVSQFLARFVAYPSEHAHVAHALWVAHTHLMASWESTPRIAFLSPEPGSGKTRSMEVSELLVPDPVAAINVTPAYLFRKCGSENGPPTILFDEIDTVFGPKAKENEEIRALLNSGHRRGATAGRCVVRGKNIETEEISSYAAVALAGLGWLPDTILTRSIIIRMRRRAPDEKIEPFRRRVHAPIGEALRRRLAGWAAAIRDEATEARPSMPAGIEDRNADVWEPLFALADIADAGWPKRAREAAVALVKVTRDEEPSLGVRLLADLRTVFGTTEELATKDVLKELTESRRGTVGRYPGEAARCARPRQPSAPLWGAIDNGPAGQTTTPKGYRRADLVDVWRRYLPPSAETPPQPPQPPQPSPDAGFGAAVVAAVADETASVAHDIETTDAKNTSKPGPVADVADVADFPGDGAEDPPGLSRRTIDQLARETTDWAYARRNTTIEPADIEADIRRRLSASGVFPESIEAELERVMQVVFSV